MEQFPFGEPVSGWAAARLPDYRSLDGHYARLRPLSEADAEPLFERLQCHLHPHNWQYMPLGPFTKAGDFSAWISSVAGIKDPQFHVMLDAEDNTPFGFCSLLNIKPEAGSIEVGFIQVAPAFQRKTAFTDAMYLMARWVFQLGYRRYEWKCDALNQRSRRAAQRLGFSYEGCFRQATVVKGRNRDTKWFSMLDREWEVLFQLYERWLDPDNFDQYGQQKQSLSGFVAPFLAQRDPDLPGDT